MVAVTGKQVVIGDWVVVLTRGTLLQARVEVVLVGTGTDDVVVGADSD